MDSPSERMPIACVQCAKAKAKCDKKVPCSRCVGKQTVCQSRATRRSSHNPNRRTHLPRPQSERALHATAAAFHVSQLSSPPQEGNMISPNNLSPHGIHQHRLSLPDLAQPMGMTMFEQDIQPQFLRNGFTQTPPDINIPITPVTNNMPHMDNFVTMNGNQYDHDGDNQFIMRSGDTSLMEFDNMLNDFMSPPSLLQDMNDQFILSTKSMTQTPKQMNLLGTDTPMHMHSRIEMDHSPRHMSYNLPSAPAPAPAPQPMPARGLQEPEAVIACHQHWPFFQCNPSEKYMSSPPKTAAIYLEGLAQTLRNQDTWPAWTGSLDQRSLDLSFDSHIAMEPLFGWSREKLLAITQGFLHKALDIHKSTHAMREDSPGGSPDSGHGNFLMLPPPDVVQYFLKSYVVRHESYYSSISGGRLNPNVLMQSANGKAASLLILLMMASGAMGTATIEARYLASGLTEACRISLFDIIEKDIWQARDPLVLRSALLFTTLAAWSGDKWHMDIAMGQRGMYLAMLTHAGMLDHFDARMDSLECQRDPERAWEEWKEHEGKHRLAYSWVLVDQEMALFSDTTPLLSIDTLHAPMPDSEELWQASSAADWLSCFERIHGSGYRSPSSALDLFTRFVDGDLSVSGAELSPTQLRLLLPPLQAQVCQLRQFISILPDGGSQRGSRAVSRAATKARLEEISALLQQWYAISKQSFNSKKGPCWTTYANLIVYHLISLNAITSFKCIEQFARKEVVLGPFRHASWLQMRCVDQADEAFFHVGQVLRLIKSMPAQVRPPWWSGAVYRVALIGWAASMANTSSRFPSNGHSSSETDKPFPVDQLTPEHESINRYLKYQEGMPMLSRTDGSLVSMEVPSNVLNHCIDLLEDDSTMRMSDGIKRKLRTFASRWKDS